MSNTQRSVGRVRSSLQQRKDSLVRTVTEMDRASLLLAAGQLTLIGAAFGSFLLQSPWVMTLLYVFLIVTGIGWVTRQELTAKLLTFEMTVLTLSTLGLIAFFLFLEALPAIQEMGLGHILSPFGSNQWSVSEGQFSLVPMILGTLITTAVAILIAAPFGIAGALFISEIAPDWLREITKPAVELLAGIPSIVYGFIGFTIINTYVTDVFSITPGGAMFTIGILIGFMALPTVVSVAEDALSAVPDAMKDGSVAMGATDWQTIKSVSIPTAFSGISAAVLLGIGRAIGETMAATVMISHSRRILEPKPYNIFDSTETLTTLIASGYGTAPPESTYMSALFVAGVFLLIIVTGLGIASQLIQQRMQRKLRGGQ